MSENKSKMYLLVKRDLQPGMAAAAIAHASLGGYLHFAEMVNQGVRPHDGALEAWLSTSFRKVVCAVSEDQFQEAKSYGVAGIDYRVMTESALDKAEVAIVFCPRDDFEPFFRSLPLWGKHLEQAVVADIVDCLIPSP